MAKRILIADDSVTIQKAFALTFAGEDVSIASARSADDGLAQARQARPDLIIADGAMPGKSGYDLCAQVRADATLSGIPVYILASSQQPYDETRGANAGADGHLLKPWDTSAFMERVYAAAGAASAQPAPPAASPARTTAASLPASAMEDDYGEISIDSGAATPLPIVTGAPAVAAAPRPSPSSLPGSSPSVPAMRPSLIPGMRPGAVPPGRPGTVPAEMSGRHVHLHVSIKEVREKQVPALDDELAKDTGEAETLDGLRAKVREKLAETDGTRIKREMERALIKELVARNTFPIAPALVDRYAQAIVNRAKSQLMMMGVDVESVDDTKMRAEVKTEAEEEARGAILLQAIGEREGINASDADVQKRIAELAQARNENPKQLRAELEKDHRIHQLQTQIREQKTLDLLISQAKITDGEAAPSLIVTPEQARQEAAGAARKGPTP